MEDLYLIEDPSRFHREDLRREAEARRHGPVTPRPSRRWTPRVLGRRGASPSAVARHLFSGMR